MNEERPAQADLSTPRSRFYAHSKQRADRSPAPLNEWEPLFTPFDDTSATGCRTNHCPQCERLAPDHGHLNKVAFWTAKFAADMLADGPNRQAARQWGHLAGVWHEIGEHIEGVSKP